MPKGLAALPNTLAGTVGAARRSLDVKTLLALLDALEIRLLVGHSKGNLVISEALFALRDGGNRRLERMAPTCQIITFSARVSMPATLGNVIDIMGTLDGFGEFNSRRTIATDVRVPSAWHHTNTDLPMHLPVTATLKHALAANT